MAEQFPALTDGHIRFINNTHIYFTGTARSDGRVNVSPKGTDSLKGLSANRIVWQNLTGSGNKTAAHLLENNRMTLMFCSFEKKAIDPAGLWHSAGCASARCRLAGLPGTVRR